MKNTILSIAVLLALAALAQAGEPPKMWDVMYLTPESKRLDKLKELTSVDGETALMTAVEHGHAEIIDMLLKAGASVSVTNKHGETALALAQKGLEKQQARLRKQQAIISTLQSPPK